jgi:excisionase family DNA binding protein
MHGQATTTNGAHPHEVTELERGQARRATRERTLRNALRKRAVGVPTYSVPEAAALLSVSHEHLYRLIHANAFPAVPMGAGRERGRYVVPARAVEEILNVAAGSGQHDNSSAAAAGGVG